MSISSSIVGCCGLELIWASVGLVKWSPLIGENWVGYCWSFCREWCAIVGQNLCKWNGGILQASISQNQSEKLIDWCTQETPHREFYWSVPIRISAGHLHWSALISLKGILWISEDQNLSWELYGSMAITVHREYWWANVNYNQHRNNYVCHCQSDSVLYGPVLIRTKELHRLMLITEGVILCQCQSESVERKPSSLSVTWNHCWGNHVNSNLPQFREMM